MTKGQKIQLAFIIVASIVLVLAADEPVATLAGIGLGAWGAYLLKK